LPDVDGCELKRKLIAGKREVHTIFITAQTDDEIADALSGILAPCVLRKPFDLAALEDAVQAFG
jgi:DNA-binding response OmpR family regulator